MVRADELRIVQFIHPGKEQTKHRNGVSPWGRTSTPHGRKFMLNEGGFVRNGSNEKGMLCFWGEYEGPTFVRDLERVRGPWWPHTVHTIAYHEPASLEGLWDTDPFVFGDRFLYNGCQQHTAFNREPPTETLLRRLAPGSVILFGSSQGGYFILDTLLVVGSFIDYPNGDYAALEGKVPAEYFNLGLHPQKLSEPTVDSYRLYQGATYSEQIGQMFSFTPCRAADEVTPVFLRPRIELDGIITQSLTQGKKSTLIPTLETMHSLWVRIYDQVFAQGLAAAHHIEMKPRRI